VRLRPIGVESLGGHVLGEPTVDGRALGLREPFAGHAGQGTGGLQANGTNGVVEQWCEELEAQRRLGGLERTLAS
jgi:hypothetical protein